MDNTQTNEFESTWLDGETAPAQSESDKLTKQREDNEAAAVGEFVKNFDQDEKQ